MTSHKYYFAAVVSL